MNDIFSRLFWFFPNQMIRKTASNLVFSVYSFQNCLRRTDKFDWKAFSKRLVLACEPPMDLKYLGNKNKKYISLGYVKNNIKKISIVEI